MANVGPSCRINTCISDRVEYRCYCFYNRREATMFSCSDHSRPSTWRRTCGYTEKYCRVCRLGGTFYFLLSFYSILYKLSSTTTCQMSHNSGFIDKKCYCYCYYYPWRIMCHNPHLFLINCTFYSIKFYWYNLL